MIMKKEEKEVRKHFVKTRMNDAELNQLTKLQLQTTKRDISSYLRQVALQKPVTVKYRNQSADDFLKQMLELKKELNAMVIILIRRYINYIYWIRYLSSGFGLLKIKRCNRLW